MSDELEFLSTAVFIVCALSAAEIPVVIPSAASIDTVNAVLLAALLLLVIICRLYLSQSFLLIGRHINPLPLEAIKLIISGVTKSAAQTRSPSFSRDSSSTIITIFPDLISSIISRMLLLSIFFKYFFYIAINFIGGF